MIKLKINYIDSEICFDESYVNVLEVENKAYFYRIIHDLISVGDSNLTDDIIFMDENYKELNYANKLNIVIDYFNIDFNNKKFINYLYKVIIEKISLQGREKLSNLYTKMVKKFKENVNDIDIDISVDNNLDLDSFFKSIRVEINNKGNVFENILLLIDLISEFHIEQILVFVNLKQYLNVEELKELYKYSIYNNVSILLIDSQLYGTTKEYEKKLIIDESLDEFVL